jgi:hypothetical protein
MSEKAAVQQFGSPLMSPSVSLLTGEPLKGNHTMQLRLFHTLASMRLIFLLSIFSLVLSLSAQQPPIDLQWTAFNHAGGWSRSVLSANGAKTAWMIDEGAIMPGVSGIWRYDSAGVPFEAFWPVFDAECGNSNSYVDFTGRNDTMWSITDRQVNTEITFCMKAAIENFGAFSSYQYPVNGSLSERATDLLLTAHDRLYICGSVDSTQTIRKQTLIAFDQAGDLIWDTVFNAAQFMEFSHMAMWNGKWMVAEFPRLHQFSEADGSWISSQTLYAGSGSANGRIHVAMGELYWAAYKNGIMHYGKLGPDGQEVFSSTTSANNVTGLTVDDQGRMWVTCGQGPGNIKVIDAAGTSVSNYTHGHTAHDVLFSNDRITIVGRHSSIGSETFLISGIPYE